MPNISRLLMFTSRLPMPSPKKNAGPWPAFGEKDRAERRLEVDSQTELRLTGCAGCKNARTQTGTQSIVRVCVARLSTVNRTRATSQYAAQYPEVREVEDVEERETWRDRKPFMNLERPSQHRIYVLVEAVAGCVWERSRDRWDHSPKSRIAGNWICRSA